MPIKDDKQKSFCKFSRIWTFAVKMVFDDSPIIQCVYLQPGGSSMRNGVLLNQVRSLECVESLWQYCVDHGFVGRCYGKRGPKSQSEFPGSNIVLCLGVDLTLIIWEDTTNQTIMIHANRSHDSESDTVVQPLAENIRRAGYVVKIDN